jgi:dihydrofolate reductase
MRKIFCFMATSADGYHERRNHELDWHVVDDEFNEFAVEMLDSVDILVFGRVTYDMMAAYWPNADEDPVTVRMNGTSKIVVSRTLDEAGWAGTRVVNDTGDLGKLKQEPGKDIVILGSSALTAGLLADGLVDELWLMIMPVVLGDGIPVFRSANQTALTLTGTRPFRSGNVLLTYQPEAS